MPYLFSKTSKINIYELNFSKCSNCNILLWLSINLNNDDAFVFAVTANACSIVQLVCSLMKTHLLTLLQDNCFDLLCCAFLSKLSGCMRNIIAFCQHLLSRFWPIPIYWQNPNIGRLYRLGWYIGLSLLSMQVWLLYSRTKCFCGLHAAHGSQVCPPFHFTRPNVISLVLLTWQHSIRTLNT